MSRDIDSTSLAVSQSTLVRPFIAVELDYPDGMVRATSLDRNITIDGHEYIGVNILGKVSAITEGAETKSYGLDLSLSGIPSDFSAYLSAQDVLGRDARLLLGFVDDQYQTSQLTTVFVGRMDTQDVISGKESAVRVAVESLFIDWERPRIRRYTDVDQKARFPTDTGFEFVAAVANMQIKWGQG